MRSVNICSDLARGVFLVMLCLMLAGCTSCRSRQGYLGIHVEKLSQTEKKALDPPFGVLVVEVAEKSPAQKAGILEDDVIQVYDGKKIRRTDDLVRYILGTKPGKKIGIQLIRNRQKTDVTAEIGLLRHSGLNFHLRNRDGIRIIRHRSNYLGVHLQALNADLAGYFKVREDGGALVLKVEEDSPARKAGLKSGDVIVRIGDKNVSDPKDVPKILNRYDSGETIDIALIRKGVPQTLRAELEKRNVPRAFRDLNMNIPNLDFRIEMDKDFEHKLKSELDKMKEELDRELEHLKELKELKTLEHVQKPTIV